MSAIPRPIRPTLATGRRAACLLPVLAALCLFGPARVDGAPPGSPWNVALDHELELGIGWLAPFDDDLSGLYDGIPVVHVRLSLCPAERVRFFLGGGYGRAEGDPWYDVPTFAGRDDAAELVLVPLQMGLRFNLVPRDDFSLNLGFLFEVVWVDERLPDTGYVEQETVRASGWSRSLGLTFGPEWRLRNPGWAIGVEGGLTASGGKIGKTSVRDVALSGVVGCVYVSARI